MNIIVDETLQVTVNYQGVYLLLSQCPLPGEVTVRPGLATDIRPAYGALIWRSIDGTDYFGQHKPLGGPG
ncbi:MAG: hypothetical protein V3W14_07395 [Candidatus Neomarinimicrobiota bacterium]